MFDLDNENWPLPSNQFDWIRAKDVFEHLENPVNFIEEVYRVAKPGATVIIQGPHFSSSNWHDPTHKRLLGSRSFDNYTEEADFHFYSNTRFKTISTEIRFGPFKKQPHKILGKRLANQFTGLYEETFLRNLFPARDIRFKLKAVKDTSGSTSGGYPSRQEGSE